MLDNEINGRGYEARLPDQPDGNVEHVAGEIPVPLEVRIPCPTSLVDRPPETPWPDVGIESFQHRVSLGFSEPAHQDGSGETHGENQEEREHGMNGQVDLRHRCGGSGDHPRKETAAVEPPPVPLQDIGRDKGRYQCRDNPFGDGMDVLRHISKPPSLFEQELYLPT